MKYKSTQIERIAKKVELIKQLSYISFPIFAVIICTDLVFGFFGVFSIGDLLPFALIVTAFYILYFACRAIFVLLDLAHK
jgi:hypothetical protein